MTTPVTNLEINSYLDQKLEEGRIHLNPTPFTEVPTSPITLCDGAKNAMRLHLLAANPHPQYLLRSEYIPGQGGGNGGGNSNVKVLVPNPVTTLTINHNRGYIPLVDIFFVDSFGVPHKVYTSVTPVIGSENTAFTIAFNPAFTGYIVYN